jgi:hypothetical protein
MLQIFFVHNVFNCDLVGLFVLRLEHGGKRLGGTAIGGSRSIGSHGESRGCIKKPGRIDGDGGLCKGSLQLKRSEISMDGPEQNSEWHDGGCGQHI